MVIDPHYEVDFSGVLAIFAAKLDSFYRGFGEKAYPGLRITMEGYLE